jgi:hypothetical protein
VRRRTFLKLAAAAAGGALLGCGSSAGPVDGGPADGGPTDGGAPDGTAPDAGVIRRLHYTTDFASPELRVREGSGTRTVAMTAEGGGRALAAGFAASGTIVRFYLRDAATGNEDHPPGGGDYRLAADLDEAWLEKGTVFDVDPRTLDIDLIDAHTHPTTRDGTGAIVYDPGPLPSLAPGAGFGMALVSWTGTPEVQVTQVGGLAAANPWLVPLAWVDPEVDTADAIEELITAHGFRGLKFHPTISGYPADGALMDPFLAVAAAHEIPVQLHTAPDDVAGIERVIALAGRFPTVRVVAVHTVLGVLDKTAVLAAMAPVPNLYAETSWASPEAVLAAMTALDSSRTLLGTDATVDGWAHYTNLSIPNAAGEYVHTVGSAIAAVRAAADPGAFENWARLTAIRLYDLRFKPLA